MSIVDSRTLPYIESVLARDSFVYADKLRSLGDVIVYIAQFGLRMRCEVRRTRVCYFVARVPNRKRKSISTALITARNSGLAFQAPLELPVSSLLSGY